MLEFHSEIQLSFGKVGIIVGREGSFVSKVVVCLLPRSIFRFVLEFDIFENRNLVVRELRSISKRCENIIAFSVQSYKFIRKLSTLRNPFKRKRLYPIHVR